MSQFLFVFTLDLKGCYSNFHQMSEQDSFTLCFKNNFKKASAS